MAKKGKGDLFAMATSDDGRPEIYISSNQLGNILGHLVAVQATSNPQNATNRQKLKDQPEMRCFLLMHKKISEFLENIRNASKTLMVKEARTSLSESDVTQKSAEYMKATNDLVLCYDRQGESWTMQHSSTELQQFLKESAKDLVELFEHLSQPNMSRTLVPDIDPRKLYQRSHTHTGDVNANTPSHVGDIKPNIIENSSMDVTKTAKFFDNKASNVNGKKDKLPTEVLSIVPEKQAANHSVGTVTKENNDVELEKLKIKEEYEEKIRALKEVHKNELAEKTQQLAAAKFTKAKSSERNILKTMTEEDRGKKDNSSNDPITENISATISVNDTKGETATDEAPTGKSKVEKSAHRDELARLKKEYEEQIKSKEETHQKELEEKDKLLAAANTNDKSNRRRKSKEYQTELKKRDELIQQMKLDIDKFTQRLAEEWSDKVGADERNLENVSIKNRPMNIAVEYENIKTQEWLEAKEKLDQQYLENSEVSEKQKHLFLCNILIKAGEIAKLQFMKATLDIYENIEGKVKDPTATTSKMKESTISLSDIFFEDVNSTDIQSRFKTIPLNLKNTIRDMFRNNADDAELKGIIEEIKNTLLRETGNLLIGIDNNDKVKAYISASTRLAWKMVIQNPVMKFDNGKGVGTSWEDDATTNIQFGSDDPKDPNNVIKYYVHPTLTHGDAVMVKGTVIIAKK